MIQCSKNRYLALPSINPENVDTSPTLSVLSSRQVLVQDRYRRVVKWMAAIESEECTY